MGVGKKPVKKDVKELVSIPPLLGGCWAGSSKGGPALHSMSGALLARRAAGAMPVAPAGRARTAEGMPAAADQMCLHPSTRSTIAPQAGQRFQPCRRASPKSAASAARRVGGLVVLLRRAWKSAQDSPSWNGAVEHLAQKVPMHSAHWTAAAPGGGSRKAEQSGQDCGLSAESFRSWRRSEAGMVEEVSAAAVNVPAQPSWRAGHTGRRPCASVVCGDREREGGNSASEMMRGRTATLLNDAPFCLAHTRCILCCMKILVRYL